MPRNTIDFGIDLGTTNSEIAVLKGTQVEVFKNNENDEFTPSVVWIKGNRLMVGRKAKERLFEDVENAVAEFKLQMGTAHEYHFRESGRKLKPEELSAEVLKSLKANVRQRSGEDVEAAVITVPADFDLPQNDATNRAAQLAGFRQCALLQEPVAAALTYGFQSKQDKVFWLVYDFGGGTFDAALISLKDDQIDVIHHGGDNQLGGKLVDWAIVDDILAPALARENNLADFKRGANPAWTAAFAKLKLKAEEAKIELSQNDTAIIDIDRLYRDANGDDVNFQFELKASAVRRLLDPFVERSINICRKVLEEAKLKAGAVERLLMVGGPTLTPYLRERLVDKSRGLGIPLEFGVDPLTVVARGAAIFAGTLMLKRDAAVPVAEGEYAIELKYDPITKDPEPTVAGNVLASGGRSAEKFSLELTREGRPWSSGKLTLPANGAFITTVLIDESQKTTRFKIALYDQTGSPCKTSPAELSITSGVKPGAAPLTHSVGVAMANGEMDVFIQKNTPLPAQRRQVHRTIRDVRRSDAAQALRIPVVEGQNAKADRNRLVGNLEIPAQQIKRDLPAGSEVEITIKIDESRRVSSMAYVPFLDQEFEGVFKLVQEVASVEELQKDVKGVKDRLQALRGEAEERGSPDTSTGHQIQNVLQRIEAENMERDLDKTVAAAGASKDDAQKCQQRVQALNVALDEIEEALKWPQLEAKVEAVVKFMKDIVERFGKGSDRSRAASLEREARAALEARDVAVVNAKTQSISAFTHDVWRRDPSYWVEFLNDLERDVDSMTDPAVAAELLNQGRQAIQENDLNGLKNAIQQLLKLLPPAKREEAAGKLGGGTVRER